MLLPHDGDTHGREVMVGVRNHQDIPIIRIFRIWVQTFLPSVITSTLYFLVFGTILGSRIGDMQGFDYMTFVVPGLVMLAIVTTSYANTSFMFF